MGTRYLTAVVKDGTHRIAQYGQFDGYPAGAGLEILTSLHNTSPGPTARGVDRCVFVEDEYDLSTHLSPHQRLELRARQRHLRPVDRHDRRGIVEPRSSLAP